MKSWLELGFMYHLSLKQIQRDLGLLTRGNKLCKGNQENNGKQILFSKVCFAALSWCFSIDKSCCESFSSDSSSSQTFLQLEISLRDVNLFKKENLCPVFRTFSVSAGSQWFLAQNKQYAKEAYFGMAYSDTFHLILYIKIIQNE